MLIKVHYDLDLRRFKDTVQTDVAVIFSPVDGEPNWDERGEWRRLHNEELHSL